MECHQAISGFSTAQSEGDVVSAALGSWQGAMCQLRCVIGLPTSCDAATALVACQWTMAAPPQHSQASWLWCSCRAAALPVGNADAAVVAALLKSWVPWMNLGNLGAMNLWESRGNISTASISGRVALAGRDEVVYECYRGSQSNIKGQTTENLGLL